MQGPGSISSSQPPTVEPAGGSAAEARTELPVLDPDLLQCVFRRLGPQPKDLVPLGDVCKTWRSVLEDVTWKEWCMEYGGGFVKELGYGAEVPPGGWVGLFKLMAYCPGLHHPTFNCVLRSRILLQYYSWKGGLGHLLRQPKWESEGKPGGFWKGHELREAVMLSPYSEDEIVVSSLCFHMESIEQAPPLQYDFFAPFVCWGTVKNFRSSELAKASGAAAYLCEGGASNHAQLEQSRTKGKGACSGPENNMQKCPFCRSPVFALPRRSFPGTLSGYDELMAKTMNSGVRWGDSEDGSVSEPDETLAVESEEGSGSQPDKTSAVDSEDGSDSKPDNTLTMKSEEGSESQPDETSAADSEDRCECDFEPDENLAVMTGFVCARGHIVLAGAGEHSWQGTKVSGSGEDLSLATPQAVKFIREHSVGSKNFVIYEQGQRFVNGLELDQLIKTEARLAALHKEWPVVEERGVLRYRVFFNQYHESVKPPVSIFQLLEDLPPNALSGVREYVLNGALSLAECKSLLEAALDTQKRRREIERALINAGFMGPDLHGEAVERYVEDPGAITVQEVIRCQSLAREKWGRACAEAEEERQQRRPARARLEFKARFGNVPDAPIV